MKAYSESTTPKDDKDEQSTPQWLVRRVEQVTDLTFDHDVCASHENHKCRTYWTKEDDCLSMENWNTPTCSIVFWMNPPYSMLPMFTHWAGVQARQHQLIVVGLVPHAPDTDWFQRYVWNVVPTLLVPDGRINFELGGKERPGNPLPSCFPIWTPWRAPTSLKYFTRNKPTLQSPGRRIRRSGNDHSRKRR